MKNEKKIVCHLITRTHNGGGGDNRLLRRVLLPSTVISFLTNVIEGVDRTELAYTATFLRTFLDQPGIKQLE
jgi:hypothetical protein